MFSIKQRVNFFDADPAGIIFYANLFKFCHTAYEMFMKDLNLEKDYFFDDEYVLPIIHAQADYKKTIKVNDELEIVVSVAEVRTSSFGLSYKLLVDDEIKASAKTVHVCVDKNEFFKSKLPEELSAKLISRIT
ncbi:MAG: acyl-CoA thioesterase [Melioribacteraceae bacterium]|nr:acyl-CoA thioesterase [Melioribacteraceae bacterium]MCF8354827.1 acyl-CoA thioesterase [Melioribacteraceae bacterium]MCF8394542.1 acyl-CoA thioesterase [Melioribacteraceae bacterium]MCF8420201.1 acyl-CoA thioesterase [Melioribacteraceae bacterium]